MDKERGTNDKYFFHFVLSDGLKVIPPYQQKKGERKPSLPFFSKLADDAEADLVDTRILDTCP